MCLTTLREIIEGGYKEPIQNSLQENIRQIVRGVQHLHKNNVIHRNITPTNILLSYDEKTCRHSMKLADFGLARTVDGKSELLYLTKCGTPGWKAPELCGDQGRKYENKNTISFQVDIFPLGCIIGYSLSGGKHPFGTGNMRDYRIENKRSMILTIRDLKFNQSAMELIQSMLNPDPNKRPTATEVLQHPFLNEFFEFCETTKNWESAETIDRFHQLPIRDPIAVNCRDSLGRTPLMLLCQKNQTAVPYFVQKLLKASVDNNLQINAKDNRGNNALTILCQNYDKANLIDIIQLLLEGGIDVNSATIDCQSNALMFCCIQYKHPNLKDIVQLFIEKNVNLNAVNANSENALFMLCQYYNQSNLIEIIHLLIERAGMDLNVTNRFSFNVLHCVCRYYNDENLIDIVRFLIEKGIEVNAKTNEDWTALHFVCRYYGRDNLIDIVRLMIEKKVDINAMTTTKDTAVSLLRQFYSRKNNFEEIFSLFIDHGVAGEWMHKCGKRNLHSIGQVIWCSNCVLGQGTYGVVVFRGKFQGKLDVAVKQVDNSCKKVEEEVLRKVNGHPNILHYYTTEKNDDFM